ncbi:hypothetical protein PENTCL1PPCAC_1090, partial [Pristionchus entomophagus]
SRTFNLVLSPITTSQSPFSEDFIVEEDGVKYDINPHQYLFEGYVKYYPNSRVFGSILDGVFDGHIHLPDGTSYTVNNIYIIMNIFDSVRSNNHKSL